MRIAASLIGIVLVLLGGIWILQGSNILAGSAMSGRSEWFYTGILVLIVGAITLASSYWRRA